MSDYFRLFRNIDSLALLLVILYLTLALSTVWTTGITWDENRYIAQSKARAYSIYTTLTGKPGLDICRLDIVRLDDPDWHTRCWEGRPRSLSTFSGLIWAGTWYMSGQSLDVMQSITANRLGTIILTGIGLYILFLFTSRAFSRRVAFFSTLALIFMPRFFAHSKYLLFDLSSAIFWVVTLWIFWEGMKNWKYGIFSGVAFGIALTTKAMSYFIPVALLVWLLVSYRDRLMPFISSRRNFIPGKSNIVFFSFILITPVIFFLLYTWLWYDTAERIFYLLGYYGGHLETGATAAFFMGENLERGNFMMNATMMLSTIPAFILVLSVVGIFRALKDTITLDNRVSSLILISAAMPLIVLGAIQIAYNGSQELMPSLPFVAILAGIGADHLLSWLKSSGKLSMMSKKTGLDKKSLHLLIMFIIAAGIIVPGTIAIYKGHNDAYYNEFFGGPLGIYNSKLLESEWSGEAYLELVPWLNENVPADGTIYVPFAHNLLNTYKYGDIGQITERLDTSSGSLGQFNFEQETILRKDINIISYQDAVDNPDTMEDIDFVVLMTRFSFYDSEIYINNLSRTCLKNREPSYTVALDDAPLVWVFETPCG
ncbi:MAG: glycosyltransferase family 39 protein [Candidatus Aenigmarchaeota archaeon]|nr:glycosyltransferase family 39 protein [Candidatus Aenigmarchaeota archaeon]